jgi:uncharacterized protein YceK
MRYLIVFLVVFLLGCSSKEVRYDTFGEKSIITKSSEDVYHDAQAQAWTEYYKALKNPMAIASIQQADGTIITINSQIPPPAPTIRQHENQYIKPVTDVMKWVVGGVVIDRGISAVVRGMGDTIVSNSGDGTVIVDRSDSIAGKSSTSVSTTKTSEHTSMTDNTNNSWIDNTNRSIVDNTDSSNSSDNSVVNADNSRTDNSSRSVTITTDNSWEDNSWVDNTNNSVVNPDPVVIVMDPPETVIVEQPSPIIVTQPPPVIVDPVVVIP